jgi:hypothetical protein
VNEMQVPEEPSRGTHPRASARWRRAVEHPGRTATAASLLAVLMALPSIGLSGAFGSTPFSPHGGLPSVPTSGGTRERCLAPACLSESSRRVGPAVSVPPAGWAEISSSTSPSPRWKAAIAYDASDGYVVLFGGANASTTFGDTWTYLNGSWTELHPLFAPPARSAAAMVDDTQDGVVLLFGGIGASGHVFGDTWAFSKGNWTNLTGSLPSPPSPRFGASIVDDAADGYVLLAGGEGANGSLDSDAWGYHGGAWTKVGDFPQVPTFQGAMTFDASDGYVLAFGGGNATGAGANTTWKYLAGVWTELSPSVHPSARIDESLGYDPKDGYVVLFGGANGTTLLNDTWKFVRGTWTMLLPSPTPSARAFSAGPMPYDALDGYLLLFGGGWYSQPADGDTWSFGATPPTELFACQGFGGANQSACVFSEFGKYFLTNVTGPSDVFGVVATDNATVPSSVTATLSGSPLAFTEVDAATGSWNSTAVALGGLRPGATLLVSVSFPTTPTLTVNLSLPIDVVWAPPWLESIANRSGGFQVATGSSGPWNNGYNLTANYQFDAGSALAAALPSGVPVQLLSGSYQDLPSLSWSFKFLSSGAMSLRSSVATSTIPITLGSFTGTGDLGSSGHGGSPGSVGISVYFESGASGSFHVRGVQLEFVRADETLGLGFNVSFQIPVPTDYGFSVGACSFNVGIAPVVEFGTGVAVTFELGPAPPGTPAGELLPGIALEITGLEGVTLMLSFGLEAVASVEVCGLNLASLSLGGQVGVNLFVQPTPLSVSGGNLLSQITWSACVLSFCAGGTLWSGSYDWGNQSSGGALPVRRSAPAPGPSNWTLLPRSYNVSQYLQPSWTPGSTNGTLVPIFYPESQSAIAASGSSPFYLYSYDNVSRNETVGNELGGFAFDGPNGSLVRLPSPPTTGTLPSNPALLTLPDGRVAATWDALPDAEALAGNPSTWRNASLATSTFDPDNGSWSPVRYLTNAGVAAQSRLDECGGVPTALVLVDTPATGGQSLQEIDLSTGATTRALAVSGLGSLDGFNCAAGVAAVTYETGGAALLALSTGSNTTGPTLPGYVREQAEALPGPAGWTALLEENHSEARLLLVNASNGTTVADAALPANASAFELVPTPAGPVAAVELYHAIELLVESHGSWTPIVVEPYGAIQGFDATFDGQAIDLAVRVNRGTPTAPEVSLVWTRVAVGPVASASATRLDQGEALTLSASGSALPNVQGYDWSGLPASACATDVGATIVCEPPAGNYSVGVTATLPGGATFPSAQLPIDVAPAPTVTITGPSGAVGSGSLARFTAVPSGGTPPYQYLWRVNGSLIAAAILPDLVFAPPHPGRYTLVVELIDSVGVEVASRPFVVSTASGAGPSGSTTELFVGALAFLVGALVMAVVVVWYRRRRRPDPPDRARPTPGGPADPAERAPPRPPSEGR